MKSRLRLSYSLLSQWASGNIDEAVALYLHKPMPSSQAMDDGKKYHEAWEASIKETKQVTIGKTQIKFADPRSELPVIVSYNDRWDIKAVFDCLDEPILYEFKTGKTDIMTYARSYQLPLYFLVAQLAGIEIVQARLIRHNQHNGETELMVIWNDEQMVEKARNYIDTLGPEIYDYFVKNGIPFDK